MIPQSIPELTNYEYNELSYNSASTLINGDFVSQVCQLLDKCGIEIDYTTTYDDTVANAVSQFQQIAGIDSTGILTTNTWQSMIIYSDKMSDTIEDDSEDNENYDETSSDSPHYNSFFDDDNYKMHRRNHKDIKIVFGNNSVVKTIKDVFMRSVTVEVDTSGNPISEIYEFIARDVTESDEISDVDKYTNEESLAPSDITYNFNFNKSSVSSGVSSTHTSSSGRTHGGGGRNFSSVSSYLN